MGWTFNSSIPEDMKDMCKSLIVGYMTYKLKKCNINIPNDMMNKIKKFYYS